MKTRRVPLADVAPGDILAEDVVDAAGRVLLPRGAELAEATLAALRRRGIDTVVLTIDDDADERAAHRAVLEQELRIRFRRAGDGHASRLLRQAALEYLMEKKP